MPLVKVKKNFQVIIPQEIRKEINIAEGDTLEMRVNQGKLEVWPVIVQVQPKDNIPKDNENQHKLFEKTV